MEERLSKNLSLIVEANFDRVGYSGLLEVVKRRLREEVQP